jgi:anti-repressor protein
VNARDLWNFLENGDEFSGWFGDRISQYDFKENVDFLVVGNSPNNSKVGRPAIEYAVTLDMAKELAMVERNAKGKEARQYFIKCERDLKAKIAEPVVDET